MKALVSFAALLALAACATAPSSAPPNAAVPAPMGGDAGDRLNAMLALAGRANAPTRAEIERAFGQPAIARQDGAGAALTYRYESCALLLLFAADSRNAQRLAQAHPSARRAGETAPSIAQCAAEAASPRGS